MTYTTEKVLHSATDAVHGTVQSDFAVAPKSITFIPAVSGCVSAGEHCPDPSLQGDRNPLCQLSMGVLITTQEPPLLIGLISICFPTLFSHAVFFPLTAAAICAEQHSGPGSSWWMPHKEGLCFAVAGEKGVLR